MLILIIFKALKINVSIHTHTHTGTEGVLSPKARQAESADAYIYIIYFLSVQKMRVFEEEILVGHAGPLLQNDRLFLIVNHFYVLLCLCLEEIQCRSLTSHCYFCCSNRSILLQQSSFNLYLMKEQREKQRRRQREPEKKRRRLYFCLTLTDLSLSHLC